MSLIDKEMDEEMYKETAVLHRRHLTDQVLRVPLKHIQLSDALTYAPDTTLQEVVEGMRDQRRNSALIVERKSRKLLGIFTERDLLLRVAGRGWEFRKHLIGEVMTPNPECVTPGDLVGFALNLMMTKGYRHLPVVGPGKPFKVVRVWDLLVYLCEYFPEDVINLPPTPKPPAERDGG